METLRDLFEDQIMDLYSAEGQLVRAIPNLVNKATNPTLKSVFREHLEDTKKEVGRLEEVGKLLSIKIGGNKCEAMQGLVKECEEVLNIEGNSAVIDAALISCARRIEHYEMAAYSAATAIADVLGIDDIADLLDESLAEESNADRRLMEVADDEIFPSILDQDDGDEDDNISVRP